MAQPTYDELVREKQRLRERLGDLEEQVVRLTQLPEQATRKGKRQAAPFSLGSPKSSPKRPGRKPAPDYGKPAFRSAPPPGKIDQVHEALLPRRCPACGGAVHQTHTACQYQVEIPRKSIYRKFNVSVGACAGCGRRVQGRHGLQTSDALGAAASSLTPPCLCQGGPDLQALIVQLNKEAGLSHGKIQRLAKTLFGIELSHSGSDHAGDGQLEYARNGVALRGVHADRSASFDRAVGARAYPQALSWLDIAELELNVLGRQCLDRRIPDKPTWVREVGTWQRERNAVRKAVDWQFATDDARIKLKRLYPQCEA